MYELSMQNCTDKNLVWIFDHLLTVIFLIVKNFKNDNKNYDQNIENENKLVQSIKYNIKTNQY